MKKRKPKQRDAVLNWSVGVEADPDWENRRWELIENLVVAATAQNGVLYVARNSRDVIAAADAIIAEARKGAR